MLSKTVLMLSAFVLVGSSIGAVNKARAPKRASVKFLCSQSNGTKIIDPSTHAANVVMFKRKGTLDITTSADERCGRYQTDGEGSYTNSTTFSGSGKAEIWLAAVDVTGAKGGHWTKECYWVGSDPTKGQVHINVADYDEDPEGDDDGVCVEPVGAGGANVTFNKYTADVQ